MGTRSHHTQWKKLFITAKSLAFVPGCACEALGGRVRGFLRQELLLCVVRVAPQVGEDNQA